MRTPTLGPWLIEAIGQARESGRTSSRSGRRDRTRRRRSAPGRWPAPGTAGPARWRAPDRPPPARRGWQRQHRTRRRRATSPGARAAPRGPAASWPRPGAPPTTRPARSRTAAARRPAADQVDAEMHAIGEVHVRVPWLAVHDLVPGRPPPERMRRRIDSPRYASTSTISAATSPSPVSCTSTQPSSAGATVSTGRSKNARGAGPPLPNRAAGRAIRRELARSWSARAVSGLMPRPAASADRSAAARRADRPPGPAPCRRRCPGGDRARDREHRPHVRREVRATPSPDPRR